MSDKIMSKASSALLGLVIYMLATTACGDEILYLNLSRDDIAEAREYRNTLSLKLTPPAEALLKQLTEMNQGKFLNVAYEGNQILNIKIHASIDSGVIQVTEPPSFLLSAFDSKQ